MKRALYAVILVTAGLLAAGCAVSAIHAVDGLPPHTETIAENNAAKEEETIVISAVGDIMMHNTLLGAGYRRDRDSYDFSAFFQYVSPLLQPSDLVIGNLETTLAGKATGYSGYPRFNSPDILAQNLKAAGFDILTTANNHCLDKGYAGLTATLDRLDEAGLLHTGTARCREERDSILLADVKGLQVAVLSYTFSTNGLNPPKDRAFAVNYIDEGRIIADAAEAKKKGAGLVIACLHFGQEYQPRPNRSQTALAQSLLNNGIDIILGCHPHVLQPAYLTGDDKFVIYSLGNFISDQSGLERLSSIILNLRFVIDHKTKKARLQSASYIPIRTHRFKQNGRRQFAVLPVEAALTSIRMGQTDLPAAADEKLFLQTWQHVTDHLKSDDSRLGIEHIAVPLTGLDLIKELEQ